jgi:hypothetical protein
MALLVGAALLALVSQSALAAGTASGTSINNSATLLYSVGGVAQTGIISAAASFVVDNKVNLTVAKVADLNILPNAIVQALQFTVTNNGNTAQSYALSAVAGAFTATMSNVKIYKDTDSSGTVTAGDILYVDATTFGSVAPDASLKILLVADQTAPTALNGQTAIYSLLAQTTNTATTTATLNQSGAANTPGVDVVFSDIAGVAGVDVAIDGKHSAFATYTVALTLPTIVKASALLCDPITADLTKAKNIPGSITQWSIVVNNPSATAVTLTSLADLLDTANLTMDPGGAAGLNSPATAAACVAGVGPYGFKVVPSASRGLGGSAAGAAIVSYFTTTTTADGLDFATPNVTATFATILPIDVGHATAGLLNGGESVTLYFNTILK